MVSNGAVCGSRSLIKHAFLSYMPCLQCRPIYTFYHKANGATLNTLQDTGYTLLLAWLIFVIFAWHQQLNTLQLLLSTGLLSCHYKAEHTQSKILMTKIQCVCSRKGVLQLSTTVYLHSCSASTRAAEYNKLYRLLCTVYISSNHLCQHRYQSPVISAYYSIGHALVDIPASSINTAWGPSMCVNVCYLIWMCCSTYLGSEAQPDYFLNSKFIFLHPQEELRMDLSDRFANRNEFISIWATH